ISRMLHHAQSVLSPQWTVRQRLFRDHPLRPSPLLLSWPAPIKTFRRFQPAGCTTPSLFLRSELLDFNIKPIEFGGAVGAKRRDTWGLGPARFIESNDSGQECPRHTHRVTAGEMPALFRSLTD